MIYFWGVCVGVCVCKFVFCAVLLAELDVVCLLFVFVVVVVGGGVLSWVLKGVWEREREIISFIKNWKSREYIYIYIYTCLHLFYIYKSLYPSLSLYIQYTYIPYILYTSSFSIYTHIHTHTYIYHK
jgi:hypothetical protein